MRINKHRPDIKTEDIYRLYRYGQSTCEIAKKFNCNCSSIYRRLDKAGIVVRWCNEAALNRWDKRRKKKSNYAQKS